MLKVLFTLDNSMIFGNLKSTDLPLQFSFEDLWPTGLETLRGGCPVSKFRIGAQTLAPALSNPIVSQS